MVDDNVSFTDANDGTGADKKNGASSSAMLDLIGNLNKKGSEASKKKGGKKGGKKKGKGKTKKVRKVDRYESQNFLFRIEGSLFCAGITVGLIILAVFLILFIVFLIWTKSSLVHYIWPFWHSEDDEA